MTETKQNKKGRAQEAARSEKYSAPALSKGLDILELLASQTSGLKKAEIAHALDRSISEIYRMLAVLQDRNYVLLDADSERYSLTMRMFELSHRHPPTKRLTAVAGEIMENTARKLNQSLHMAILHDTDILVIAQVDPPGNNITSVRLGARVPLMFTASGACLAHRLAPDRRDKIYALTDNASRETIDRFEASVKQVQDTGVCQSPSPVIEGVYNIAVPIFGHGGEVSAALTIPYVNRLMAVDEPDINACKAELIEAGKRISEKIGAGASARS
ncbi:IclR family transcriptional regulator [Hoeflea prorocentri]|uniref:IclR family transcriptional regulator n=1 Tax=Hoeflea prorocentri TaxID=1922333 RepID=A0A9X3UJE7_9HYPH|nr:IclR family transcriptional regulator [Hoeflea prorocentri]MCY6381953.1 IclR family transcriptional regulator [Hoeflea prorocentri]MDA5399753.1 IclR family transcriptional regulator [Hoeflea prorocentri]